MFSVTAMRTFKQHARRREFFFTALAPAGDRDFFNLQFGFGRERVIFHCLKRKTKSRRHDAGQRAHPQAKAMYCSSAGRTGLVLRHVQCGLHDAQFVHGSTRATTTSLKQE
jgi:hypothetical protein